MVGWFQLNFACGKAQGRANVARIVFALLLVLDDELLRSLNLLWLVQLAIGVTHVELTKGLQAEVTSLGALVFGPDRLDANLGRNVVKLCTKVSRTESFKG